MFLIFLCSHWFCTHFTFLGSFWFCTHFTFLCSHWFCTHYSFLCSLRFYTAAVLRYTLYFPLVSLILYSSSPQILFLFSSVHSDSLQQQSPLFFLTLYSSSPQIITLLSSVHTNSVLILFSSVRSDSVLQQSSDTHFIFICSVLFCTAAVLRYSLYFPLFPLYFPLFTLILYCSSPQILTLFSSVYSDSVLQQSSDTHFIFPCSLWFCTAAGLRVSLYFPLFALILYCSNPQILTWFSYVCSDSVLTLFSYVSSNSVLQQSSDTHLILLCALWFCIAAVLRYLLYFPLFTLILYCSSPQILTLFSSLRSDSVLQQSSDTHFIFICPFWFCTAAVLRYSLYFPLFPLYFPLFTLILYGSSPQILTLISSVYSDSVLQQSSDTHFIFPCLLWFCTAAGLRVSLYFPLFALILYCSNPQILTLFSYVCSDSVLTLFSYVSSNSVLQQSSDTHLILLCSLWFCIAAVLRYSLYFPLFTLILHCSSPQILTLFSSLHSYSVLQQSSDTHFFSTVYSDSLLQQSSDIYFIFLCSLWFCTAAVLRYRLYFPLSALFLYCSSPQILTLFSSVCSDSVLQQSWDTHFIFLCLLWFFTAVVLRYSLYFPLFALIMPPTSNFLCSLWFCTAAVLRYSLYFPLFTLILYYSSPQILTLFSSVHSLFCSSPQMLSSFSSIRSDYASNFELLCSLWFCTTAVLR